MNYPSKNMVWLMLLIPITVIPLSCMEKNMGSLPKEEIASIVKAALDTIVKSPDQVEFPDTPNPKHTPTRVKQMLRSEITRMGDEIGFAVFAPKGQTTGNYVLDTSRVEYPNTGTRETEVRFSASKNGIYLFVNSDLAFKIELKSGSDFDRIVYISNTLVVDELE